MPGMPHKEAKDYLDSYLARKSDQGMAVLIDGHWGAGKTEFVTKYFKERKARISHHRGAKQPPDYLYASFFGASDEVAISDQFLSQLYPSLNSKIGKVLGTAAFRLGSALVEKTSRLKNLFKSADVDVLREWAAQPRERIVVFDDLERAELSLGRALALINGFVERDGIRAIVIANESEIKSDEYDAWKEKVIGKSLFICAHADEVVKSIADNLPSGAVKHYLTGNGGKVAEVVRASTYPNYRSVKNLIADVHRVVSQSDDRLGGFSHVVESLILFSVGIGAEFRAGKLSADEILSQARLNFVAVKSANDSRMKDVRQIYAKYENVGAADCFVPINCLIVLWKTGELRLEEIKQSVMTNPRVVGETAAPPWRRLWATWDLSQSSYERAKLDALAMLDESAVTVEGELLHIVGAALQVEDYGAEFFPKVRTLEWLDLYLRREEVRSQLKGTSIYDHVGSNTAYAGLGYAGQGLPAFKEARKLLTTTLLELDEKRKIERLEEYVERLRQGDYEPVSLSGSWDASIPYGTWLHLVDPAVFASILIDDGRVVQGLSRRLQARYDSDHSGKLRREWRWLLQVWSLCKRLVAQVNQPHRTICQHHLQVMRSSIWDAMKKDWKRRNRNRVRP